MSPRQTFPERRCDGSAIVAAVFSEPLSLVAEDVSLAFAEWREGLSEVDVSQDLAAEPVALPSDEGFRIVFEIRPGSRLWRDWAVALISALRGRLGESSFAGFYDVVAGRMHRAVLLGSNQDESE